MKLFVKRKEPFWDQPMGNFTFRKLYNQMISQNLLFTTKGMELSGQQPPSECLLDLFQIYYTRYNAGLDGEDRQDGAYGYSILSPKLLGYGLITATETPNQHLPHIREIVYRTSELGHKFHAELEKLQLKEAIEESKKRKKGK
ncbi:hypothetical protein MKQ68_19110 [Chitinophaga horti]|uniref:Uncharacterized protein n=1 Tax=Chitinophaga horti TaxID=2920382 RepID=A0ABY6IY26_9BACT|nr:hypothetical protein [Chitinophaga horti]UYQ92200.1 hypothetical protein MKQ68_19110 [Chitinophaga horti]